MMPTIREFRLASLLLAATALAGLPATAQDRDDDTVLIGKLMWAAYPASDNAPWDEADEYCETLELAGHQDWRLPTLVELEALYDPATDSRIRSPFELDDCCLWSSTSLEELGAERKAGLANPMNADRDYFWGFLYSSGTRYYSVRRFADGRALCVRDVG
jgi:hypothetical protein